MLVDCVRVRFQFVDERFPEYILADAVVLHALQNLTSSLLQQLRLALVDLVHTKLNIDGGISIYATYFVLILIVFFVILDINIHICLTVRGGGWSFIFFQFRLLGSLFLFNLFFTLFHNVNVVVRLVFFSDCRGTVLNLVKTVESCQLAHVLLLLFLESI